MSYLILLGCSNHTNEGDTMRTQHLNSISEAMTECRKAIEKHGIYGGLADGIQRESFIGRRFQTWDDVEKAATSYWQEGLDKVEWMLYEIEKYNHKLPAPKDRRRKKRFNDNQGDDIDNDRLRSGQSDFWIETRRETVNAPQRIAVLCQASASFYHKWDSLLWRGVAAIVIADLLEKSGYRVELYNIDNASNVFYHGEDKTWHTICLKDSHSPLDIAAVVNALSGWFYRTVMFQLNSNYDDRPKPGLGIVNCITQRPEAVRELVGEGTKVVIIEEVFSEQDALDLVRKTIEEINANA